MTGKTRIFTDDGGVVHVDPGTGQRMRRDRNMIEKSFHVRCDADCHNTDLAPHYLRLGKFPHENNTSTCFKFFSVVMERIPYPRIDSFLEELMKVSIPLFLKGKKNVN